MRKLFCLFVVLFALPAAAKDAQNPSGLPVPRFVSFKSGEVNVRSGPGTRYPIQWVFRKEGWPVEIVEEFDQWRKVRDAEGTAGWVHKTMLSPARTALIKGKEPCVLRADPDEGAHAVLKAEPGVLVRLAECKKDWCRVQASARKGWIRKAYLWGVYTAETFGG